MTVQVEVDAKGPRRGCERPQLLKSQPSRGLGLPYAKSSNHDTNDSSRIVSDRASVEFEVTYRM